VNEMTRWTGLEATLLRLARRMTVREFADHLGITSRMVSKWSNGGRSIRPRPEYQALLDESLRRCTDAERERLGRLLQERDRQRPEDADRVRWCLVVDVSPGDIARMAQLELAVNAVLDGPFFADPV
jgi:transcriptional regulator with XRE-family HTH domain